MTRDFGGRLPTWSFRESPLVDGDKVICTPGAQDAMLVALNKLTGKTIWKSEVPASSGGETGGPGGPRGGRGGFGGRGGGSGAAYASVIAIDFEGQRQYVQLTTKGLIGVAASDGKFLWRYDRPANGMGIYCSTPLYHDSRVFAASAYGAFAWCFTLAGLTRSTPWPGLISAKAARQGFRRHCSIARRRRVEVRAHKRASCAA